MPSLVSALPSLNPPSFPTLVSISNAGSYSSFAFATPTNAALALGLTASLIAALAVHRIRRARLADCEAAAKTTAAGLARRASVVPVPREELGFRHFFTCVDENNEIDTADIAPWWFVNDPLSRGPYHLAPATPKSTIAPANTQLTAGDTYTSFTADVEHAPEVLDLSHLFATLVTDGEEDADTNDDEEDFDYSYWPISRSVAEMPFQEVVAFLPNLTGAPIQEASTAEVEHDPLGFGYLFSAALEEEEDEEEEEEEDDDVVAHDLNEVSGYPTLSALDAIRIQVPSAVAILQIHNVAAATPTEISGSRHVAFRPGKGHTVSLRAPPRSSSAVLAPRSPLATPDIKVKRASSLKRFAAAFKRDQHGDKGKEENEKENVKPKANGKAPGRVARRILAWR
ncbi:hypothetical protein B0H14DRAFT_2878212 [Mycena olivaceomarginata]|nr:hypothetical protein B0H14DRAFT_2878212 [Mycena olivaceomarginata]